jgi:hypothetical protein
MFDPFDQVRMRTQQLLASGARIREERALLAASRERPIEAADSSDAAVTRSPDLAPVATPAAPDPAQNRAA